MRITGQLARVSFITFSFIGSLRILSDAYLTIQPLITFLPFMCIVCEYWKSNILFTIKCFLACSSITHSAEERKLFAESPIAQVK